MSYDIHFLRDNVVDVNAAVIGISRKRWEAIKEEEANETIAQATIQKRRYDILPIESVSGVREYFQTKNWNDYSAVSRKRIIDDDIIHYKTSLRDLIDKLVSESRLFFFLQDDVEIVGLVSIVHLNARQVKVYLFNLLSELEVRLSRFLSSRVLDEELLKMEFETPNEENSKVNLYEEAKKNYRRDIDNGVDVAFTEYLYLSHFITIIRKKGLHQDLRYSGKQFDKLGALNELRNQVAHPNRSIITDTNSVEKLLSRIKRIEEALSRLRKIPEAVC
jgi:hypothetical protein